LVDHRLDATSREDLFKVATLEVGDSDGLELAFVNKLFKGTPGLEQGMSTFTGSPVGGEEKKKKDKLRERKEGRKERKKGRKKRKKGRKK